MNTTRSLIGIALLAAGCTLVALHAERTLTGSLLSAAVVSAAAAGLAAATTGGVLAGPRAIFRAMLGGSLTPLEQRALAQAARAALVAGFLIGLAAVLMILVAARLPDEERSPARYAGWLKLGLAGPLAGTLLGPITLGALAQRCGAGACMQSGTLFAGVALALAIALGVTMPVA